MWRETKWVGLLLAQDSLNVNARISCPPEKRIVEKKQKQKNNLFRIID